MIVYFISGLGADERAFKKIKLSENLKVIYIRWPEHDDDESFSSYCLKIAAMIDTSQEFSLVGFSFGGMIAIELSRIMSPKKVIIISSITSKHELPSYLKMLRRTRLHKIVPAGWMNKTAGVSNFFNNIKDKEDAELAKRIIRETNPKFIKWAIDRIANWSNADRPDGIYHIHGSRDNTFYLSDVNADKVIEGGGHLMILTHAGEISAELNVQLFPAESEDEGR